MFTFILISLIFGLVSYLYYFLFKQQTYWKDHNIPYVASPLLLGNFFKATILKENVGDTLTRIYNHPNVLKEPFVGFHLFHQPALMIRDPELVKQVLIKNFQHFSNRYTGADPAVDPIGGLTMFQIKNPAWKPIRTKLSPVFTSGKMKQMLYMVERFGNDLVDVVTKIVETGDGIIETRHLFAMFTVDSISLVAFATEANCLKDPTNSEFLKNAEKAFQVTFRDKVSGNLLFFLPPLISFLRVKTFNSSFNNFLRRLFNEVMTDRETNGGNRNDLIDFLVALKRQEASKNEGIFTEDVMLAQAAVIFFAGFETSSSTLEFVFYELAKYPEIQKKVCDEIRSAIAVDGKISYEMITNGLPYTTNVINEVLRLYPILPFLDRVCDNPEGVTLEASGKSVHIPRGMPIYIPAYAIQRDPKYFSEPEKFNPDRFDAEKRNFNEYTYMPFGIGPRNCIGERFAMMQMRVAMAMLLNKFNVEMTANTPKSLNLDKTNILLHPEHRISLKFVPVSKTMKVKG
ncbi:probable cytochrome P450 6g2 [Culicoides brevitarsis]|uniref:probable cytochrome P450 6g2 n=1 Tax=Culicoides brevitarsis TaxID=469753 RepID=UPI00307C4299